MQLSVCMIVRNEEKNLPRALASVTGVADEIVVVDTGSQDTTVAIAKGAGARVFYFPWVDDFSAARNAAIAQAGGEWLFWMDADEELLLESQTALKNALNDETALAFHVLRRDLVDSNHLEHYTEMWQLRLFRNRMNLHFQGRCHPYFSPTEQTIAVANGLAINTSKIILRHYGYLDECKQEKLERAARLLELELCDRPGQLYYLIEYGRTLLQLKDPRAVEVLAQATGQMLKQQDQATAPTPMAAALSEYLLQLPIAELPNTLKRETLEEIVEKWFPRSAPLIWIRAQQAFAKADYVAAESLLRQLVSLGETQNYDRHISFDPRIMGDDARLNLGVCLVRQAKLKKAKVIFRQLLKSSRKKEAQANLKTISNIKHRYGG